MEDGRSSVGNVYLSRISSDVIGVYGSSCFRRETALTSARLVVAFELTVSCSDGNDIMFMYLSVAGQLYKQTILCSGSTQRQDWKGVVSSPRMLVTTAIDLSRRRTSARDHSAQQVPDQVTEQNPETVPITDLRRISVDNCADFAGEDTSEQVTRHALVVIAGSERRLSNLSL